MASWQGALNQKNEDYGYRELGQRVYPEKDPAPDWGCLVHPDELRHVLFVGNSLLVTVNGEQLTDFQLKGWVDHNARVLADKLRWDIYPRLWRCRALRGDRQIEPFAEWEDCYRHRSPVDDAFKVVLRKKPVARIHRWVVTNPFTGGMMYDMKDRMLVNHASGILEGFAGLAGNYQSIPGVSIRGYQAANRNTGTALVHEVDYTTGYDHASRVPEELKEVIMNRMIIDVMSAFGDGIVGGLANSSVSVGVMSESIGTTMSATSAYFGARIVEKQKWEEEWFKTRASHYRGVSFGHL